MLPETYCALRSKLQSVTQLRFCFIRDDCPPKCEARNKTRPPSFSFRGQQSAAARVISSLLLPLTKPSERRGRLPAECPPGRRASCVACLPFVSRGACACG